MSKKMTQLRYYGRNNPLNKWPDNSYNDITHKYVLDFTDTYAPVVYLGILANPGSKFWFNDATLSPIIIGASGIYQLDLTNSSGAIEKIFIDEQVIDIVDTMYTLRNVGYPVAHLIIDMVYEGEEDENISDSSELTPTETDTIILYHETGTNTDGAMTLLAVTLVLENIYNDIVEINEFLANFRYNLYDDVENSNIDGAVTLRAVKEALDDLKTRISDLGYNTDGENISALEAEIENLKQQINAITNSIGTITDSTSIATIYGHINAINALIGATTSTSTINERIDTITANIGTTTSTGTINLRIDNNTSAIDAINNNIGPINSTTTANINGRINAINDDIGPINSTSTATINGRINNLVTNITNITSALVKIEGATLIIP